MNKKILFLLVLVVFLGAGGAVSAATISLPNPLCPNMQTPCAPGPACICGFADLIERIVFYLSTIIGILAVLMFVIAGIYFVISAGNPEKIKRARDIAIWAAIGVAISLAGTGLVAVVKSVIGATPS
ncbi:MAG: hypothetical protein A3C50_02460 [Candidatus Staskawiczbacteria bacterium RIFCSPHIGHO2_02_FULL_43_16]|uniref:Uncharacterized protein n=1 Tax=Candidatus Staskawiczbacteria bacterium RIFCSPHIGHO2_01_FULL_41_41 TaxID=1802203 RepID=A0A1G2HVF7_9BACT|nr:MAG: hypothetical protein A2822_01625 [Candidatus Staskawiczbacteria bacterium RIFCSPHIGHO2_01_FULL_41_41]OGZ68150.1 MAG: hypothetical protein A3C50_02460 [Candidatus Staskawiczbacteria bacterium RIFCSPHIGHO2_02_FULL_43_16]OGZ74940.1 MAG: hypothetical protein A3A12_03855 [Candidatus Staskawiczbacteria bacterium RIFCSPLOWO2_01_FULL_43_17b]